LASYAGILTALVKKIKNTQKERPKPLFLHNVPTKTRTYLIPPLPRFPGVWWLFFGPPSAVGCG